MHRLSPLGPALGLALLACATTVSEKNRDAARINYDVGVASLDHGDSRAALRALLTAIELDPTLPEAHNALGLVYHGMGKLDDALAQYEAAVRLNPKFSEAYNNLGALQLDMGHYDDAIASFKVALSDILYATPTLAEGNMGWAYYKKGDAPKALEHIGNAVAIDPHFCRGYEWLMRIALDQKRPAEVLAQGKRFQKHCLDNPQVAAQISPDYRNEIDYYLALGHLQKGDRVAAQAVLTRCAAGAGDDDPGERPYAAKCAASLRSIQ
jgi:type IV pilus assembly protein PilF